MPLRLLLALSASLALLSTSGRASAFCRTQTCETNPTEGCQSIDGCRVGGANAHWPNACLTFAVHSGGSPKLGLSAAAVTNLVTEEFARWSAAECGDGNPTFLPQFRGEVECNRVEYNCEHGNVNIVMFHDASWPHQPSEIALTTVTMNIETGEILDADLEVNSEQYTFKLDDPPIGTPDLRDLRMVMAHELGHFLGLSHANDSLALMRDGGKTSPELSPDDVAGVCEIYPAANGTPSCKPPRSAAGAECNGTKLNCPREEEESGCSCSVLGSARTPAAGWLACAGLAIFAFARNRRGRERGAIVRA
jgi:hypothetical protein